MKRADQATTVVIALITVAYLFAARSYEGGAGTVPTVVGGVTLGIALLQLLGPRIAMLKPLLGKPDLTEAEEVFHDPHLRRRLLVVSVSLLAIPLLIALVGMVVALPIYVAIALGVIGRQSLLVVIGCTVLIALVVYVLLVVLIAFPVDDGYVWQLL